MNAAEYARYSTEWQDKNSIAYQHAKISEYCLKNNINIVAKYSDEEKSGTNTDRPGFQKLISDARTGLFDAVVIYDITRGSRDVVDWFDFRKIMRELGVQVISVEDNLGDILDPSAFLTELVTVGIGQHHVLTSRQKSMDGSMIKAKQGLFMGGNAPLGYDIVNRQYVVNPAEAVIVKNIFEWYANDKSYDFIIDHLKNERTKLGRPFGKNSLYSILRNIKYTGAFIWNENTVQVMRKRTTKKPTNNPVLIENQHEAIISTEVWEMVQHRLANHRQRPKNKSKRTYLLSGLITCDSCGCAYVGHTSTNTRGCSTAYYVCGNKYRTHTCKSRNINAIQIETYVIDSLKSYLSTFDIDTVANQLATSLANSKPDVTSERVELAQVNTKIKNIINAIVNGIDADELRDELSRLKNRQAVLTDIVTTADNAVVICDKTAITNAIRQNIMNWTADTNEQLVKKFVKKINAHSDGSYTVKIGVHSVGSPSWETVVCTTFEYTAA